MLKRALLILPSSNLKWSIVSSAVSRVSERLYISLQHESCLVPQQVTSLQRLITQCYQQVLFENHLLDLFVLPTPSIPSLPSWISLSDVETLFYEDPPSLVESEVNTFRARQSLNPVKFEKLVGNQSVSVETDLEDVTFGS